MTNNDLAAKRGPDINVVQRYPIVFWSDYFIAAVLFISLWLYYLKNRNGLAFVDQWLAENGKLTGIVGSIIVIVLVALAGFILYLKSCGFFRWHPIPKWKKKETSSERNV